MPYVASLDGIRAIAILAVLVFHVWPPALRGGFTGVDVFFVLSGFLITSIVLRDMREGVFSMREFYLRRAQRLLPNSLLMILAVLGLWAVLMSPHTVAQTAWHALWAVLNASNIYIWKNLGGYWGDAAEWAPLTHTWSLGVEEQFYLLFPAALLALTRRKRGALMPWLGGALAVSFGLCLIGTWLRPLATFYWLPTRVWELLAGAMLAAHLHGGSPAEKAAMLTPPQRERMAWLGLALVLAGFFIVQEGTAFPGVVALAPVAGTALLLLTIAEGETRVSRLLAAPFMVGLGRRSYSLYLWHWPFITLGKVQAEIHGWPPLAGAAAGAAAGCVLACAAYAWVEQPLRQRGPDRRRRLAVVAAGFAAVVVACASLALRPARAGGTDVFERVSFHGALYDVVNSADASGARGTRYHDVDFPAVPARPAELWRNGGLWRHHGSATRPQVVVLGSSHALMYARVIDDICRQQGLDVAFLCADSTPAFFETQPSAALATQQDAAAFDEARRQWLRKWRPEALIVIDRWDLWEKTAAAFAPKMQQFLQDVTPCAGRVLWLAQVPALRGGDAVNMRDQVLARMRSKDHLPRLEANAAEAFRQHTLSVAEQAAAAFPSLRVLRTDRLFYQDDGSVRYAEGRAFYYADDDHLSDRGAEVARPLLQAAIAEAHASAATAMR